MNTNRDVVKMFIVLAAVAIIGMNVLLLFNWPDFLKGLM